MSTVLHCLPYLPFVVAAAVVAWSVAAPINVKGSDDA
jgi:hypothetical protein